MGSPTEEEITKGTMTPNRQTDLLIPPRGDYSVGLRIEPFLYLLIARKSIEQNFK
jgi:hypothetical protein